MTSKKTSGGGWPPGHRTDCWQCGRSVEDRSQIVSYHGTSQGMVTYGRCACGKLQLWLGERIVAPAQPKDPDHGDLRTSA